MRTAPLHAPEPEAVRALVRDHPFATVIARDGEAILASPLPLFLEEDGERLIGHLSLADPLTAALRDDPRALVIFQGPHGYVSPSWFQDRTQAPTWNYATVHYEVEIRFRTEAGMAAAAVDRLSLFMERGRPGAWSPEEMGARHAQLVRGVIAFEAVILSTDAKFKLGQEERPDTYRDILAGLAHEGATDLVRAMRQANAFRDGRPH